MAGFSSSLSAGRTKMHECSQCWHTYRFPNPYCPSPRFTSYEDFPSWKWKAINLVLIHSFTLSSHFVVISECPDLNLWLCKPNHTAAYRFLIVDTAPFSLMKTIFSAGHGCFGLRSFHCSLHLFDLLHLSQRMELWFLVFYPDRGKHMAR